MAVEFTKADYLAAENGDGGYINDKGAKAYREGDYAAAAEYYRLGAAMGCAESISNLGYCYMYANGMPKNMSIAIAYFKLAASMNCIDALYKLSSIYKSGAEGIEADVELSVYYCMKALQTVGKIGADPGRFPSLYFFAAKELMPGGSLLCDLNRAYYYLMTALRGYRLEEAEGITYHKEVCAEAAELMKDSCFDGIREAFEENDEDY